MLMIKPLRLLILCGASTLLSLITFIVFTNVDRTSPFLTLWFLLPSSVYLLTVFLTYYKLKCKNSDSWLINFWIFLFAIAMRLLFLFLPPTLSDDIYRYYWDGKLLANGIIPYLHAPNEARLVTLRDPYWEYINNKDVISPYPPLLEIIFMLTYLISPNIFGYKILSLIFDLLCIIIIILILRNIGVNSTYVIIYAWHPLVVLEFASSGHSDSIVNFFVLLTIAFLLCKKKIWSALLLSVAVLIKLYPVLFAPIFFRIWRLKGLIIFIGIILAGFIPFIHAFYAIFNYLFGYRAVFNGSLFKIFTLILNILIEEKSTMIALSKSFSYVINLVTIFIITLRQKNEYPIDMIQRISFIIMIYLMVGASIHPWYATWFIPLLCFYNRTPLLIFSLSVFASYYTYSLQPISIGYWPENTIALLIEYIPFYGAFAYECVKRKKQRI